MLTELYPKLKDRWPIRKSIDKINSLVGAPVDRWSQDPEIELSRSEYIPKLLGLYGREDLDEDDNFYVMSFLFACFEGAAHEGLNIDEQWQEAVIMLQQNVNLHAYTLAYWSCYDAGDPNDPDQMFPITEKVRGIWDLYSENYV